MVPGELERVSSYGLQDSANGTECYPLSSNGRADAVTVKAAGL